MEKEYNIEKEKKLIEFLGYSLSEKDNSNRWIIFDENKNKVGFIQYKKWFNKNKKKRLDKTFGYFTEIESNIISYKYRRKDEIYNSPSNSQSLQYSFEIKTKNKNNDNIELCLEGDNPGITIWSNDYGYINFYISYNGLHLNYTSKTENHNIDEYVHVNPKENYSYILSYCNKDKDILNSPNDTKSLEIDFEATDEGKLKITQKIWKARKYLGEESSIVNGTIKEAIELHKMGIESFSHFRYIINKIVPIKGEIIEELLKLRNIEEPEYLLLMPDIKKDDNNIIKKL